MDSVQKERSPRDILTAEQLEHIISRSANYGWHFLGHDINSATEGMAGFLGDHFKLTLYFKVEDSVKNVHLFVKIIPHRNAPKATFINQNHFFQREALTFSIFDEMPEEEFSSKSPWSVKAVVHDNSLLVLPDLSVEGYRTYPAQRYFDMEHVLVAVSSLARFHAAFARHHSLILKVTNKCEAVKGKFAYFLKDPQFFDCPWLRATIKCTTKLLEEFSTNIDKYPKNLQEHLIKWCTDACASIKEYDNTLNVIIHKDLWANNILFRYDGAEPVDAVLIDFQCARYAPPAFDVMIFLYYTTSRKFRQLYETEVLLHYYMTFSKSVDEYTKNQLKNLNYDRQEFLGWCERARPAGMMVSIAIHPFILMSPLAAQKSFDEPQCFQKHYFEDRSGPVLAYARDNHGYKTRLLEISEEFVEMHLESSNTLYD